MVISKSKAEEVAIKLTEKQKKEANELWRNFYKYNYERFMLQIPADVRECFLKNKAWFSSTTSPYVYVEGQGRGSIQTSDYVPYAHDKVSFVKEEAEEHTRLKNAARDADNKVSELQKSITNALLALKTYKNILAQFPEAAAFIEKPKKMNLPAIKLDDIRQKLAD